MKPSMMRPVRGCPAKNLPQICLFSGKLGQNVNFFLDAKRHILTQKHVFDALIMQDAWLQEDR